VVQTVLRQASAVRAPGPDISVAVLPLRNLSGDPAEDYFSDGTTDALIASLARIRRLRVISRSSVFRYKGSFDTPLAEVARSLGVSHILEGSVLRDSQQVIVHQSVAGVFFMAGDEKRSTEAARMALDLSPDFWLAYFILAEIASRRGEHRAADEQLARLLETQRNLFVLGARGRNFATWGKADEARAILAELEERAAAEYVAPSLKAKILFALGQTDAGFAALEQGREERDQSLSYLKVDPNYAVARTDPRFALLLARMGL